MWNPNVSNSTIFFSSPTLQALLQSPEFLAMMRDPQLVQQGVRGMIRIPRDIFDVAIRVMNGTGIRQKEKRRAPFCVSVCISNHHHRHHHHHTHTQTHTHTHTRHTGEELPPEYPTLEEAGGGAPRAGSQAASASSSSSSSGSAAGGEFRELISRVSSKDKPC